jgi:murein L,D-transpeptidase YcbB/YkuD
VHLAQTLPVLILYWTVDPHLDGDIQFYPDVYQRDAPILAALDAPFRPARRP